MMKNTIRVRRFGLYAALLFLALAHRSAAQVDSKLRHPTPSSGETNALVNLQQLLGDLKHTYRPGGLPARIRIQGEISDYWEKNQPKPEEVLAQIEATDAPEDYRIYFAHTLRNYIKRTRYTEQEANEAVDQMLAVVGKTDDSAFVRSEVAMVVADFDPTDKAVAAIAPLLEVEDDQVASRAVTALRKTGNLKAADALVDFVQKHEQLRTKKPMALLSALTVLSGHPDKGKAVIPIVKDEAVNAPNIQFFQGTMMILSRAPSSVETVEAIVAATESATRFTGKDKDIAEAMGNNSLRRHEGLVNQLRKEPDATTQELLRRTDRLLPDTASEKQEGR